MMEFISYPIDAQQRSKLQELCPLNTYRVIDVSELPFALPPTLLAKTFEAIILMGSGATTNNVYMVNLLRVDSAAGAVDQQPLIIASSGGSLCSGFVQHGNWKERSVFPPDSFFVAVQGSGITGFYPFVGIPSKRTGDISELKPDSHQEAFWKSIGFVKFQ